MSLSLTLGLLRQFDVLDYNADGGLQYNEFSDYAGDYPKTQRIFDAMDSNKDRVVTYTEILDTIHALEQQTTEGTEDTPIGNPEGRVPTPYSDTEVPPGTQTQPNSAGAQPTPPLSVSESGVSDSDTLGGHQTTGDEPDSNTTQSGTGETTTTTSTGNDMPQSETVNGPPQSDSASAPPALTPPESDGVSAPSESDGVSAPSESDGNSGSERKTGPTSNEGEAPLDREHEDKSYEEKEGALETLRGIVVKNWFQTFTWQVPLTEFPIL